HPAVPVVGIFAHADVGYYGQVRHVFLDLANCALDFTLVVPGLAALWVLARRDTEQNRCGDACGLRFARRTHDMIHGHLRYTRHRGDRAFLIASGTDKDRPDKVVRRKPRLAHHPAQRLAATHPAWPIDWERHRITPPAK